MNSSLISHLEEIVKRLNHLKEKGRAYNFRNVADKLKSYNGKILTADDPVVTAAIGKGKGTKGSTYTTIQEFLLYNRSNYLDDLRRRTPEIPIQDNNEFREYLKGIYGFGDKKIENLLGKGYTNLAQIVANEKLNEHQKQGIYWRHHLIQPIHRSEIDYIKNYIISPAWRGVKWEIAGSYRRKAQVSGDIDVLVLDQGVTIDYLVELLGGYIVSKLEGKIKKATDIFHGIIRISEQFWARRIDIRLATSETWAYKLFYFTGSKFFNIRMRERAKELNMKLDEYSLMDRTTGKKYQATTEIDIFRLLELDYVAPEDRK